jgi:hypothetical protein
VIQELCRLTQLNVDKLLFAVICVQLFFFPPDWLTMVSDSSGSDDNRLRLRRTQSESRAEEITYNEQKERKKQPDKP